VLIGKIDKLAERMRPRRTVTAEPPRPSGHQVVTHIADRKRGSGADVLVDADRLAELEDIARDAGFMTELLRGFKSDVESIVRRMDEHAVHGRLDALPDLLHALKGAAVGVGARQLSLRCEEMAATGMHDAAAFKPALAELRRSVDATFACLDDYARSQHKVSL